LVQWVEEAERKKGLFEKLNGLHTLTQVLSPKSVIANKPLIAETLFVTVD
jgi:hypothetical protein